MLSCIQSIGDCGYLATNRKETDFVLHLSKDFSVSMRAREAVSAAGLGSRVRM